MEFSYTISESEFRQAWRIERKASSRSSLKNAAFWMLVMVGLLLLYRTIQSSRLLPGGSDQRFISHSAVVRPVDEVNTPSGFVERVGPFLVIAGVWILVVKGLVPMRLLYLYRRDPRMHGQFKVNISRDSICTENTAGTTSMSSWNVYDYWCEGKNIIVLMFYSGTYSILSLARLSQAQRGELRGILSAAPKKK
jgi:hypothetical protein